MNILFVGEPVSYRMGAERVILGSAKALKRLGENVVIADPRQLESSSLRDVESALGTKFDIVHWFGTGSISESTIKFLQSCKIAEKPVFVTTTLWPFTSELILKAYEGQTVEPSEILHLVDEIRKLQIRQLAILNLADVAIATSKGHAERANEVLRAYGYREWEFEIVPNAIDEDEIANLPSIPWKNRPPLIVCAARVELLKNPLRLIEAFKAIFHEYSARLIFLGRVGLVLKPEKNIEFLGEVSPQTALLLIANAKVHALPSLGDFPALSHLEAAALGCSIVGSQYPWTTLVDYLPEAHLVDPTNVVEIADALREALETPPDQHMRERVYMQYTFRHVAYRLKELYSRMI